MMKPTRENYETLQRAYDFFNVRLFDGELPQCLITFQRRNRAMGYYAAKRFTSLRDKQTTTDEIALNPMHFVTAEGDREIIQTLVHEMCHLWQHHFGKPSRSGYHNKEWARKMEAVGLIPTATGRPGGKRTGQKMADYPEPDGRFERAFDEWAKDNHIEWADTKSFEQYAQMVEGRPGEGGAPAVGGSGTRKKSKQKFTCPNCGQNAWAKPSAQLVCGVCVREKVIVMEAEGL